jgi:uroporphyrinogen decarboxylase
MMNKRDLVLSVLDATQPSAVVPAAFFLHFDPAFHRGQPAVDKHLEYFRYTGMDFVKIQYENNFPQLPQISRPEDWEKMPFYDLDFYKGPLEVVKGLVKAAKAEALVILTLYSPFMLAGQTTSDAIVTRHIQENPQAVKKGMQVITESLLQFVKACGKLGLDGFYTSTQGGEADRFADPLLFDECIRPYDLALMDEVNRDCIFNILHVCDYRLPYRDLSRFTGYPGQVVNTNLELIDGRITAQEVAQMFKRPFMGGLDRLGILAHGSLAEVQAETERVLAQAPGRFILGADCTVPADTKWDNLRAAVQTAHRKQPSNP